jgi:autotransporter-associated beta strand protein
MKTILFKTTLGGLLFGSLFVERTLVAAPATTVYSSGGFEAFIPGQNLDGQDPAPPFGAGPWAQDNGTSIAEVTAANPIEGLQSVKITRGAGATGDTRWGVLNPVTPGGLSNVVNVYFDLRVVRAANAFGPLFGIEAYDASSGAPKLIGSLVLDAGGGEILCRAANSGAFIRTGAFPDLIRHHHYRLSINFNEGVYSLYQDGFLVHTEGFVDPSATMFTDAPLATLGLTTNNNSGIAYFDNYVIEHTTSQLPYLVWRGDGSTNTWAEGGNLNWNDGLASVTYSNGAAVRFDDDGSAAPGISLEGNLFPASVTVAADQDYEFGGTGSLQGATGLLKEGTGMLILANTNGYAGETTVAGGELSIRNSSGSATGTNKVSILPQCTISGNGTIGGSLWVASGGNVEPGTNGPGQLTIGDHLVLDDASLHFDLGIVSDQLVAGGDLTVGGELKITAAAGFGPGTYTLITYDGNLAAGVLQVTEAPPGFYHAVNTNTPGAITLVVTLPPSAPSAPASLAAMAMGSSRIDLTWQDTATNETRFVIERSHNGVDFASIAVIDAEASGYADMELNSGTTYYYRVKAGNAGGESPYSNVAHATTEPANALVWYEFEGNTFDSSGNNHHATPAGVFTYGSGKMGAASAIFNGSNFGALTKVVESNFTVAAWIKTTGTGVLPIIDAESPGTSADWGTLVANGKFGMFVGAPDTFVYSTLNVNDGAWHHVAATRRSDTGEVRLYVDGVLNKIAALPAGPRTASIDFHVGANHSPTALAFFTGNMDDVKLFDVALNPAEIAAMTRLTFAQWQLENFGCTNCPQAAAGWDADGDGMNNGDEFAAGTSPTNSLSNFKITALAVSGNDAGLTWTTVGGRTNFVQAVAGGTGGSLSSSFIDVSGPIVISGTGDTTTNFVDVGAADGVSRYYRVRQSR